MATGNIIVQGAGGHAHVVMDCAVVQGYTVVCVYDPKCNGSLYGVPIRQEYNINDFPNSKMVVAIGDNATRKNVSERARHPFANVVHPSAVLSSHITVGEGNVVLQGAIVQAESKMGSHIIINTGAQVDHDCVVEDFAHLAPGVILCGNVYIGEGAFIGAGTTIIPGKKVGAWSIVGAGSVVIDNIPDNVVAVGNPARVIKYVSSGLKFQA
ncbi:acetyltransferase [Chryseolinea sp. H1M3-3]|uniref:acetyltransferase n=1 Tax=Chryseolinea sp. H1M3-3 TaxID=3034144 RepID=UPI0023ED47CC|nr:acetyltransferase [Chryseolinea sp. H1M3-3]